MQAAWWAVSAVEVTTLVAEFRSLRRLRYLGSGFIYLINKIAPVYGGHGCSSRRLTASLHRSSARSLQDKFPEVRSKVTKDFSAKEIEFVARMDTSNDTIRKSDADIRRMHMRIL